MNRNLKTGDTVIYFFSDDERHLNNRAIIAPAIVLSRPWQPGGPTLQLKVLADGPENPWASSCQKATDLERAVKGQCWTTIEECEAWGVDLTNYYQDLDKLIADNKAAEATKTAPAEEKEAESTEESKENA